MTDQPPQQGLTRTDTDHPHPLFGQRDGHWRWYITDTEMRNIQRRADRRGDRATDEQILHMNIKPIKRGRATFSLGGKKGKRV